MKSGALHGDGPARGPPEPNQHGNTDVNSFDFDFCLCSRVILGEAGC